jgi:hypothetical protein
MPVKLPLFKLTPSNCLIYLSIHETLLMEWFDGKLAELKMIYRGKDHKFTRKSWDDHCLDKGPTLTVIQVNNGRIFGGYTS